MTEFIEKPVTPSSLKMRRPLYGVGINDAWYVTQPTIDGEMVKCPYYQAWQNMITRSCSEKYKEKHPTYIGCSVVKEWLTFSNFRNWMKTQDWSGKQLDKDILLSGNKIYSPKYCVFVSSKINTLFRDSLKNRGDLPQGVTFHKREKLYKSQSSVGGKSIHIGLFKTESKAEYEYCIFKSKLLKKIAYEEEAASNSKLQEALLHYATLFATKADDLKEIVCLT